MATEAPIKVGDRVTVLPHIPYADELKGTSAKVLQVVRRPERGFSHVTIEFLGSRMWPNGLICILRDTDVKKVKESQG